MSSSCKSTVGKRNLRWPGIEPGSTAWKAAMLTTIPPSPPEYKIFPQLSDHHVNYL